jgi:hypothetical protein
VFDIHHQKDWAVGVLAEYLIDLNIMCFERISSGIPPYEFLSLTDLHERESTLRIIANMDSW